MGTTIHFKILKSGNKSWWNATANRINDYGEKHNLPVEPMPSIEECRNLGGGFVKTYAKQPYHNKVINMLKASRTHGFVVEVRDELDNRVRRYGK